MIYRQLRSWKRRRAEEVHHIEQLLQQLPAKQPRAGLKGEMLAAIMAEVKQGETHPPLRRSRKKPAIGFALSLAGCTAAVALMITFLPHGGSNTEDDVTALHTGGAMPDQMLQMKQMDEEIAMRKQQREEDLLKQMIPNKNGVFLGEGVEVTVNDVNSRLISKGSLNDDVESSFELVRLVQDIYDHGGQLVSINGIIVRPYTQIVTHGTLSEVQSRRIQSPFVIKVIGDSVKLQARLTDESSALLQLKREKEMTVDVVRKDNVTIEPMD